jgi:hypothetical protein
MRFASLCVMASVLLLGACAHRTRELGDSSPHDPELITATEIAGVNGATVYDAVQHLRPAWLLRSRPNPALPNQILILYIDGQRYGSGIDGLRTLPLRSAYSVEFLSPTKAEARFGPGHSLGAIEVLTNPH